MIASTSYSPSVELNEKGIPQAAATLSKDLLSLGELTPQQLHGLLDLADEFKVERETNRLLHRVPNTTLAMIFEKPSTRTRVSFEVGMSELGGHAVVLNSKEMQLARGETVEDTALALSQYCHAIGARVVSHETLVRLSEAATVPVINALSDLYHPCQTLADLQTVRECKAGELSGLKLAWVGDGNNVCNSLLIGAALSAVNMWVACPKRYEPSPDALSIAKYWAEQNGSEVEVIDDPREVALEADIVATDTFVSMGQDEERQRRLEEFLPDYQVNEEVMSLAKPDAIFLHCLPAHRAEEVTPEVIDGPRSVVWQEVQNRLHSQKAVLYSLIGKNLCASRQTKRWAAQRANQRRN